MTTLLGRRAKAVLPFDLGSGFTLDVMTIDPDKAVELLDTTIGNRSLNSGHVKNIAMAMKQGRYRDHIYDPLRITSDGYLADGHHRLHALIDSGTTHEMMVITGYSYDDYLWMDQNVKRNTTHTFQVLGLSQPRERASVANLIERMLNSDTGAEAASALRKKASPPNADAAHINSVFRETTMHAKIAYYKKHVAREFSLNCAPIVSSMLLQDAIDPELAERFWDGLILGTEDAFATTGDPRGALNRKLRAEQGKINDAKAKISSRDTGWDVVDIIVWVHFAFLKFKDGLPLRQVKMSDARYDEVLTYVHNTMRHKWLTRAEDKGYVRSLS